MARRRRFGFRRKARGFARKAYRSARRSVRSSEGLGNILIGGAAYGAIREPMVSNVMKWSGNFAGDWTDEVIGFGASYLAYTKGSGYIRSAGRAGLTIEAARLGKALSSGMLTGTSSNSSGSTSTAW
jgi:hypothetical protein